MQGRHAQRDKSGAHTGTARSGTSARRPGADPVASLGLPSSAGTTSGAGGSAWLALAGGGALVLLVGGGGGFILRRRLTPR